VTVTTALALALVDVTVTVAAPGARPSTKPELETAAMSGLALAQLSPDSSLGAAISWTVWPTRMLGLLGSTVRDGPGAGGSGPG
jgi:hypothetical protein